jgi:predicted DNA-binding transcriptional regulator YafY
MSIATKKAVRLLWLRDCLLAGNQHTASELAQRLGVSQRTIQRDLEDLQAEPLRVPLVRDGWRWSVLRE